MFLDVFAFGFGDLFRFVDASNAGVYLCENSFELLERDRRFGEYAAEFAPGWVMRALLCDFNPQVAEKAEVVLEEQAGLGDEEKGEGWGVELGDFA